MTQQLVKARFLFKRRRRCDPFTEILATDYDHEAAVPEHARKCTWALCLRVLAFEG